MSELNGSFTPAASADGTCRVVLQGEIDLSTLPQLRRVLRQGIEEAARSLEIDLSGVGFIDAGGVGALVEAVGNASERGIAVTIARPTKVVRRVFDLCGFDGNLPNPFLDEHSPSAGSGAPVSD